VTRGGPGLQNEPPDPSQAFVLQSSHFFVPEEISRFDAERAEGEVRWKRMSLRQRISYHQATYELDDHAIWKDTPEHEYEDERNFPFKVSFVSPRTVRLRLAARPVSFEEEDEQQSLMLPHLGRPEPWELHPGDGANSYRSSCAELIVGPEPGRIELRDADGARLTRTNLLEDSASVLNVNPIPLSFVRESSDLQRSFAASLALAPDEALFGCGESFTRLDKRGQRLPIWTYDAYSAESARMYKPVPFLLSSRGWGALVHSAAPMTFDLGNDYDGAAVLYLADDVLDLFLFAGSPKEIVSELTALTGRPSLPPLWSFGLWMGRESYESQDEVLEVARRLRQERIPSDVIHVDTHWPEVPFRCDFRFSPSRFPKPKELTAELERLDLRLSIWQFPYVHPADPHHEEVVANDYAVLSGRGRPPVDDAVLDLSNPDAVGWYQEQLEHLFDEGVAVFTSDFGEAAPLGGIYHDSRSSFQEHNLYPVRYNRAVVELTERVRGYRLHMARSAYLGSQPYPLHFGGDPETSNDGMAGTLRGGLSLGLCGFTFWTHFVGGFPKPPSAELYLRWLAFGVFTSHLRCHGQPPREPWEFGEEFTERFRRAADLRYRLLPYLYTQAALAAEEGHPLIRPLFFEFPEDPTSWLVEDEFFCGREFLVAPLLEDAAARLVYLPPGEWIDYQRGDRHAGPAWKRLEAGRLPIVILVRAAAAIPRAESAQSTEELDWGNLALEVFAEQGTVEAPLRLPEDPDLHRVVVDAAALEVIEDPLQGRVRWSPVRR
jgi:alpha-D-xyloside xylohydrolase